MKFETISLIIVFGSLAGMAIIILRKIPLLISLQNDYSDEFKESFLFKIKNKILNISFIKNFNLLLFLQKILSKTRILVLKTENKIGLLLYKLRQKSQNSKNFQNSDYWQKLKSIKSEKKNK